MGGRGAASGAAYQKDGRIYNYGDEYGSVHTYGNIKYVYNKQNISVTAPVETMTDGRIYVTLDRKIDKKTGIITLDEPKYITFFENGKKRTLQYDIDGHWHGSKKELSKKVGKRQKSHRHVGYNHDKKSAKLLNDKERKIVADVMWEWRKNVRGIKKIYP